MVIFWDFETTQEGEGENVSDLRGEQSVVALASATSDPEISLATGCPLLLLFVDNSILFSAYAVVFLL